MDAVEDQVEETARRPRPSGAWTEEWRTVGRLVKLEVGVSGEVPLKK
jgi:hypothetical protein